MSDGTATATAISGSRVALTERAAALNRSGAVIGGAVALGALLRVLQLVSNRSLSGDESFLALNVADGSWGHLLHRLDFNQVAPTLFLLAEKLSVTAFGREEVALRLVPFFAGLGALLLFPALARRLLRRDAVAPAVVLFAFCDPVIAWASTDKQYEVDVFATVLLLLLAGRLVQTARPADTVVLGAAGVAIVWFSFPAAVTLAGIGTAFVLGTARRRRWRDAAAVGVICVAWLVSFVVEYRLAASGVHALQDSLRGMNTGVVSSSSGGSSLAGDAQSAFRYVSGIPVFAKRGQHDAGQVIELLLGVLWVIGLVGLARTRRVVATMLALPVVFAFGAAVAHAYPLLPRAMLYMTVPLCLGVAEGIAQLVSWAGRRRLAVAGVAIGLAVAVPVVVLSLGHAFDPRATQEMRPALRRLAADARPRDTIYVLYSAQYGLRWYLECGCAGAGVERARDSGVIPLRRGPDGPDQWPSALASVPPRFLVGSYRGRDPDPYVGDLRALKGRRRVWVLLANVPNDFRATLLAALDDEGTRLRSFRGDGDESAAAYYLYDLR